MIQVEKSGENMEKKLVKEYSLNTDILREGCIAYQKKFVYPKSYVLMCIFLILAANFVYGIVNGPINAKSEILASLLIMLCLALAFREWYNPRKQRRSIVEAFHEMEIKPIYRLTVSDEAVEISTVSEILPDDSDNGGEEALEASVIPIDNNLSVIEKNNFFTYICKINLLYCP